MAMTRPTRVDPESHTVAVRSDLTAELTAAKEDPPVVVHGMTIGIARMSGNSPHGGEMHPDGDEVLYLISGHARVVFELAEFEDVDLFPGQGLVVPKGVWHRVDILEPCEIMYATPGPGGDYRPIGYSP